MADNKPKTSEKQKLLSELNAFLATPHGKIREAVEHIAKALETLIKNANKSNMAAFQAAVKEAMMLPKSTDRKIDTVVRNILEHAKEVLNSELTDLVAANENIKQEKLRLKKRLEELHDETQSTQKRPGSTR